MPKLSNLLQVELVHTQNPQGPMRPLFWWSDSDTHNIFFNSNLLVLHILWRLHWKKTKARTQPTGRRFLFCRGFANKLLWILGMSFCDIFLVKTHLFRGLRGVIKGGSGVSRGPGSRFLEDYHSFLLVPTAPKSQTRAPYKTKGACK